MPWATSTYLCLDLLLPKYEWVGTTTCRMLLECTTKLQPHMPHMARTWPAHSFAHQTSSKSPSEVELHTASGHCSHACLTHQLLMREAGTQPHMPRT